VQCSVGQCNTCPNNAIMTGVWHCKYLHLLVVLVTVHAPRNPPPHPLVVRATGANGRQGTKPWRLHCNSRFWSIWDLVGSVTAFASNTLTALSFGVLKSSIQQSEHSVKMVNIVWTKHSVWMCCHLLSYTTGKEFLFPGWNKGMPFSGCPYLIKLIALVTESLSVSWKTPMLSFGL